MHQLARVKRMEADIKTALTSILQAHVTVENGLVDLPTPGMTDNIQLLDNTVYRFNGTNNIGVNHLVKGSGTIILGEAAQHDSIVSTTPGALIRAAGGNNIVCKNITLTATLGSMFDGDGCPNVLIDKVIGAAIKYGRFEDCNVISLLQTSCAGVAGANSGVELVNASPGARFAMVLSALIQDSAGTGILIDFGSSVWASIAVELTELVSAAAGTDIDGLVDSGNLVTDIGRGRFQGCVINGAGTHLDNITLDDILWAFNSNTGIADSVAIGSVCMSNNAVATTIAIVNTPVKVAGTTTLSTGKRYDDDDGGSPADNHLRSIGKENNAVIISVSFEITKSGSTKDFNLQMFKNSIAIGVPVEILVTNGETNRSFHVVDSVSENDVFDLRMENTVDTDNATVTNMEFTAQTAA